VSYFPTKGAFNFTIDAKERVCFVWSPYFLFSVDPNASGASKKQDIGHITRPIVHCRLRSSRGKLRQFNCAICAQQAQHRFSLTYDMLIKTFRKEKGPLPPAREVDEKDPDGSHGSPSQSSSSQPLEPRKPDIRFRFVSQDSFVFSKTFETPIEREQRYRTIPPPIRRRLPFLEVETFLQLVDSLDLDFLSQIEENVCETCYLHATDSVSMRLDPPVRPSHHHHPLLQSQSTPHVDHRRRRGRCDRRMTGSGSESGSGGDQSHWRSRTSVLSSYAPPPTIDQRSASTTSLKKEKEKKAGKQRHSISPWHHDASPPPMHPRP
jgi:hypothetical protein